MKVVRIGAKVVTHGRYAVFQMAELALPREMFRRILKMIDDLRPRPGSPMLKAADRRYAADDTDGRHAGLASVQTKIAREVIVRYPRRASSAPASRFGCLQTARIKPNLPVGRQISPASWKMPVEGRE